MKAYYSEPGISIYHGDSLAVLPTFAPDRFSTVITDPPYHLTSGKRGGTGAASLNPNSPAGRSRIGTGFMGKAWDGGDVAFRPETWAAVLRVCKPGAMLLAFGGSRTFHRLTCAIEDAGWEIRDCCSWLYGSGFPKSLDISKAIDSRKDWTSLTALQSKVKAARVRLGISQSEAARRVGLIGSDESLGGGGFMWFETGMRLPTREQYPALKSALGLDDECDAAFESAEREVVGEHRSSAGGQNMRSGLGGGPAALPPGKITKASTDNAKKWNGWGTALKPAWEPIIVAMKPLDGTFAQNALQHGVAGLNIDGGRINPGETVSGGGNGKAHNGGQFGAHKTNGTRPVVQPHSDGRFPANVLLDEWHEPVLRLRDTINNGIIEALAEYFNGYQVRGLRVRVQDIPEQGCRATGTILRSRVLREGTEQAAVGFGPLHVREEAPAGITGKDAPDQAGTREEDARYGQGLLDAQGLPLREHLHTPAGSVGDGEAHDFEGETRHRGASTDDGDGVGASAAGIGIGASSQRGEGRQSAREPRTVGQLHPQARAQGNTAGASRTEVRERAIEVLACDIPSGWLKYFQPTEYAVRMGSAALLDEQSGELTSGANPTRRGSAKFKNAYGEFAGQEQCDAARGADAGGASRFFYTAKASKSDRGHENDHPTVKPTDLLKYLCTLTATPTGGEILDPFGGSMTTLVAARECGRPAVAIELMEDHCAIGVKRLSQQVLFNAGGAA